MHIRAARPSWRAWIAAVAAAPVVALAPSPAAAGPPTGNPCDLAPLPQCAAAIGPLRDITARWRDDAPATIQVVPIWDYATDPEDGPPPGAGVCGSETGKPAADGSTVAPGQVVSTPPAGIPPPPGDRPPPGTAPTYCLLHYFAGPSGDFPPPCPGCHRLLIDYAAMAGTATAPPAGGHWAARFTTTQQPPFSTRAPFNGHSPNIKNLCADKFFNPSPGSTCTADPLVAPFDEHGAGFEGDATIYHHYPALGRYYNGPRYLAGDGAGVPYHWVHGAYIDLDTGGAATTVWYGAGYRGRGDTTPDTDWAYGCACEVPPLGHAAYSPDYAVSAVPAAPQPDGHGGGDGGGGAGGQSSGGGGAGAGGGGGDGSGSASSMVEAASVSALPDTAPSAAPVAAPAGAAMVVTVVGAAALRRRRIRREPAGYSPGPGPISDRTSPTR